MKKAAIVASVISVFVFSIFYFGNKTRNSEIVRHNFEPTSTELLPPSVEKNIEKKQKLAEEYGKLPLHFEPNLGQTDEQVKFMARGQGYALFLTGNEAVLSLEKPAKEKTKAKRSVIRMQLESANPAPESNGLDETAGKTNYFIGNDPAKWQTDIPNYKKVKYSKVYDGVDLVYYGNNQRLEYDFVVAPNADPDQIKLKFDGIKNAEIEERSGDLLLETELGTIRQHKPFSYQMINGEQKEIASLYQIEKSKDKGQRTKDEFTISFRLADYDKSKELVIDPILVYGSYLGGSLYDAGSGVTVDAAGNAYLVGTAASRDFPTTAGTVKPVLLPRTSSPNSFWYDAYVTKVNPTGTGLVFSTYYGGRDGNESGGDIEVDAEGNIYFSGTTMASDFPTVNAYQTAFGGTDDAFLAKLNSTGSQILFSTYLGGNNTDLGGRIVYNPATGEVTAVGRTSSPNFPTTPGVIKQKMCDSPQSCSGVFYSGSFVARFTSAGTVQFATLFDAGLSDVKFDVNNNAVVAGGTSSAALTTPGAYQTVSSGGGEGYLGKLNPTGSQIVFGTLLGGGIQSDSIAGVALDAAGNMYVAGTTENVGFPTTPGAFDTTHNGATSNNHDGFLTKFNPLGSALVYSTFLGGTGKDEPKDIALGSDTSAFVVGETTGASTFPVRNSILTTGNIFLTHFNQNASALEYSTILGQGGGYAVAVDANDNAYITGRTNNIPTTPGSFQPVIGGGQIGSPDDGYILKIGETNENQTFYSISGTVTDQNTGYNNGDYSPVVVTVTGTVNRTVTLGYNGGNYHFGNLPAGGNYTVTAKRLGYETSPQNIVFNNLGANQFGDFTILRNRFPEAFITSPVSGTEFDAPATIAIQANASDPDGDAIAKVEFSYYTSAGGSVPLFTDTEAPYEFTWENVPVGTYSLYATPTDSKGLRGQSMTVVHVHVINEPPPGPITVSITSPTEGQTFEEGSYVPISVDVSPNVAYVDIRDQGNNPVAYLSNGNWSTTKRFTTRGTYTLKAWAFDADDEFVISAPVTFTVGPMNHVISGLIRDSLTNVPVEGITLNLTSQTNTNVTATTTTAADGTYSFTNLGLTPNDGVIITPSHPQYEFDPESRTIHYLGFINWENQNFSGIRDNPITVQMTSPTAGQTFPPAPTITLTADASTTDGAITQVEFYKFAGNGNHILIGTDTTAPYSFQWTNVPGGNYQYVFARATSSTGGFNNSAQVMFHVQTQPATIRLQGDITNAAGGWMPGITVRLTGTANGNPINQTSVSNFFGAYGFFNLPAGGDYTITPEAPNTTFTPPSFSVTNATADNLDVDFQASNNNTPPTVSINSPADGSVFTMPAAIPFNVTSSDFDGNVSHLSLTATGNSFSTTIAQSNNGTINVNWQPNQPGAYVIWATATDNGGLRTSVSINITVNPPAPVSISGRVVDRMSQGIEGVTMELRNYPAQNTVIATAQTDSTGNYTIPNITTFNSYILKASKDDYTFSPQQRTYLNISTNQTNGDYTGTLQVQPSDFDGDRMSDVAVWRPSSGVWYVKRSTDNNPTSIQFGGGSFGDEVVPGNYDGDHKIDYAVYRKGVWYILNSSNGQSRVAQFGLASDKVVPGDYDGDGRTDLAVWRPENGVWYIWRSSDGGYDFRHFGMNGDIPLAGDYDGDGITDLTVFRPSTGVWYVLQSVDANFRAFHFGQNGDKPLVGDFDGDKKADYAVYRPTDGVWHVWNSRDDSYKAFQWGISTDTPVPGDYDRDGKTDFAVYRKAEGNWYIFKSATNSYTVYNFGLSEDIPVPAAFVR